MKKAHVEAEKKAYAKLRSAICGESSSLFRITEAFLAFDAARLMAENADSGVAQYRAHNDAVERRQGAPVAMPLHEIISLARAHVGDSRESSSAALCLRDAEWCVTQGMQQNARKRAIQSLEFSLGMFHPLVQKAKGGG